MMKFTARRSFWIGDIVQLTVSAISNKVTGWVQAYEIDAGNSTVVRLELSVFNPITMQTSARVFEKKELDRDVCDLEVIGHEDSEVEWERLCILARRMKTIARMT